MCVYLSYYQTEDPSSKEELCRVLLDLLDVDQLETSLLAAVLLSHLRVERNSCIEMLKAALAHPNPNFQSQVSQLL